jgi:hypothetical protein
MDQMEEAKKSPGLLRDKINRETAKIPWIELLRFFAQGRVVLISQGLDLVEIAALSSDNRSAELESWASEGKIAKVSDEQAQRWLQTDALLWTVVVKPWVFVQETGPESKRQLH